MAVPSVGKWLASLPSDTQAPLEVRNSPLSRLRITDFVLNSVMLQSSRFTISSKFSHQLLRAIRAKKGCSRINLVLSREATHEMQRNCLFLSSARLNLTWFWLQFLHYVIMPLMKTRLAERSLMPVN
jgi:hypothetical protein